MSIFISDILPQTFFDIYGAFLWLMKIRCNIFFPPANLLLLKLLLELVRIVAFFFAGMMACSAACNWKKVGVHEIKFNIFHFSYWNFPINMKWEILRKRDFSSGVTFWFVIANIWMCLFSPWRKETGGSLHQHETFPSLTRTPRARQMRSAGSVFLAKKAVEHFALR